MAKVNINTKRIANYDNSNTDKVGLGEEVETFTHFTINTSVTLTIERRLTYNFA